MLDKATSCRLEEPCYSPGYKTSKSVWGLSLASIKILTLPLFFEAIVGGTKAKT